MIGSLIVLLMAVAFAAVVLIRSIRVVPAGSVDIVERLGRYQRTLEPGLNLVVPFVDRAWKRLDLSEQEVTLPPAPVITNDDVPVDPDVVVHYQVIDPVAAVYEISDVRMGIQQLVITTLRGAIGEMDVEKARTWAARRELRDTLRAVLDEATEVWGVQVTRVDIKAIEPVNG
jgi:regulator of protease activity HflC (stomatin/prohibitin superfamily)